MSEEWTRRMEAVSDDRGVIRAAAMDQRGSLKKTLSKEMGIGPEEVTQEQMEEFKSAVVEVLSPYASGVLLDPEYGGPASGRRSEGCGLLLAYEKSGYDNTDGGRIPVLLPDWTVRQLVERGADCVKLLLYYNPFADEWINDLKHSFVERIGVECAYYDIPFFLEFVGYDLDGSSSMQYAKKKPEIVTESMREFSKDIYKVAVLKVEIPVDLRFTSDTRAYTGEEAAYSREDAMEHYRKAAEVANRPFIYLSAGVSDEQFRESLEIALEAGVPFSGVLCGRATWQDGIPVYARNGVAALKDWLSGRGVENIQALNRLLDQAHPWRSMSRA